MDKTNLNLWKAFIGEAKANRMYTAYAIKALEEGHPEIAQIFYEVAGAETVHAIAHLKAMDEVKSTYENLKNVVENESYESGMMYPRMIQEAQAAGRHEAVQSLRLAMEREAYHLGLFQEALKQLEKKLGGAPQIQKAEAPARSPEKAAVPPLVKTEVPGAPHPRLVREVGQEKKRIVTLERIREVVFGTQDGLISTVALVSSVAVATPHRYIVIVAGLANALAGMISMSTGSYLSSKAEKELHAAEIEKEALELEQKPEEEMAEMIEIYRQEGMTLEEAEKLADRMSQDRQLWLKTLVEKELGLSLEQSENPAKDALTMGVSFILGAAVPLLPYFFIVSGLAIPVSIGLTLLALFGIGAAKTRLTHRNPWRSGLEILAVGSASALLGYLIGTLAPKLLGMDV